MALNASEEFGARSLGEQRGGERGSGVFGEDGAEEFGLYQLETAFLPIGADQGVNVEALGGGLGGEGAVVIAARASYSAGSSPGRMMDWASSPCFRALKREAALPSAERGPVDFCALARLARICAGVAIGPM